MIRYVYVGDQVCKGGKSFSFWNTVTEKYIKVNHSEMWDNEEDFVTDYANDKAIGYLHSLDKFNNIAR